MRSTLSKPENFNDVAYYDNAYIDPLFVVKGAQAMVSRGNNGLKSCLVQLMDWIICNPGDFVLVLKTDSFDCFKFFMH